MGPLFVAFAAAAGALGADGDFGRQTSQAFAESAGWFAGTPTAQREIRREEEHACSGEDAIEKIHSVGVARRRTWKEALPHADPVL